MSDLIYYCTKENNDCSQRNECERYLDADSHTSKTTLFKTACTNTNNKILFIKREDLDVTNNINNFVHDTKESDSTEKAT